ncbi:MAG: hypothetical protein R3F20_18990 [Planctomycetota bacterium]
MKEGVARIAGHEVDLREDLEHEDLIDRGPGLETELGETGLQGPGGAVAEGCALAPHDEVDGLEAST